MFVFVGHGTRSAKVHFAASCIIGERREETWKISGRFHRAFRATFPRILPFSPPSNHTFRYSPSRSVRFHSFPLFPPPLATPRERNGTDNGVARREDEGWLDSKILARPAGATNGFFIGRRRRRRRLPRRERSVLALFFQPLTPSIRVFTPFPEFQHPLRESLSLFLSFVPSSRLHGDASRLRNFRIVFLRSYLCLLERMFY